MDYLRNRGLHYLVYYDTNHQGAARYLDKNAAAGAISATLAGCNAASIDASLAPTGCRPDLGDPTTWYQATIADYANNGLDSASSTFGYGGAATGAAFPGINPNLGQNQMLFPIGISNYNGLDVSFKQQVKEPLPGVKGINLEVSYSLSRFNSMAFDQDFGGGLTDFDNYNHYIGPNALDRTHQFSFGGVFTLAHGLQLSLIVHADSPLPQTLTLTPGPERVTSPGQIFQSDLTGDGTDGDVLPGTNIGSFGRSVTPKNINNYIDNYDNKYAGKVTPAGQALVDAQLFTEDQLVQLGGVAPELAQAPAGQVGMGGLFYADLAISYIAKIRERITLQPSVTFYNLTNSQNFDQGSNVLSGTLQAAGSSVATGYANSTTYGQRTTHVTLGSGVYGSGGPRVLEFGLKFTF